MIWKNREIAISYIEKEIPQVKVVSEDATYLLWIDCSSFTKDSVEFTEFVREKTGLYLSEGEEYGGNGNKFVRMNLAWPKLNVEEGVRRFKKGIEAYIKAKN